MTVVGKMSIYLFFVILSWGKVNFGLDSGKHGGLDEKLSPLI